MNNYISTTKDLNNLVQFLSTEEFLSLDTEFIREGYYYPKLCLIQISTGNFDAHIVQLNRSSYDAPNLVKILADKTITKIFHYGRADMAHIKYYLKTDTHNILDTKIA